MSRFAPAPLLLCLLATGARTEGAAQVLPGVANADGRNGTRFRSEVVVVNAGAAEALVRFRLVPGSGTAPAPTERRLAPGATLLLGNALEELWGLSGTFGSLEIESETPLALAGATRNVAAPAGTYGVGLGALRPLEPGGTAHAAWLSHSGDGPGGSRANLTVALLDPGSEATLEVRDERGALVGSRTLRADVPVTWQGSLPEVTGGASVDPGSATLRVAAGRAAGFVSTVDNATGDGLLCPFTAVGGGEADLLLDGVARGPGARGTRWTSGLRVLNPGVGALLVSVDAAGVSPVPPLRRVELTVAAGGLVVLEDALGALGAAEGSAGGLRLRAAGPLLLAAATTTPDPAGGPGRFGVAQAALPRRGGLAGAGDSVTLPGLRLDADGTTRTNVALLADSTGASATLVLRDAPGAILASTAVSLGSSEWRQRSLAEWFGVAEAAPGSRVDVTVETGALHASATVIDGGTGDAVARPAVPLPATLEGAAPGPPAGGGTTLTLGAPAGRIRPLLGVNVGPGPAGEATVDLTDAYHAAGVTAIRTHDYYGPLDMATLYPDQGADPASPASYDFAASDAVFARILEGGFEPYLRLGDSWSAAPGYPPAVPRRPTNPANWVRAAVEVVRRYDDAARWAGRPLRHVEVWNEPDNGRFWDGTHEEFVSLFVAAVSALKAEFPHLPVGGPGFAPSGALAPQGQALTRALVAGLAGAGVAPDFLSFHVYSNDPEVYRTITRFYRDELDRNGLAAVELHVNEWHTETRNATKADALALRTGGRGAAIVTAAQVVLQEEGIAESCVYRGPDPSASAPEFYGFFFADGRPKRPGLALGLWKGIADHAERLALTASRASGPALYALAGRDGAGRTAILVANPSAEATTIRVARDDGVDVAGARLEVVSDASEETVVRVVAGERFEVPGWSALLVSLLP